MLKLTVTQETGETAEQTFEETEVITIGRAETNRVVTGSRRASRNHCRITHESGRWVIEDLGSQNGTHVNGDKITQKALAHGDEIRIADCRLVVGFPGEEKQDSGPAEDKTVFYERPAADPDATTFGLASAFSEETPAASSTGKLKTALSARKVLVLVCIGVVLLFAVVALLKKDPDQPDKDSQLVEKEAEKVEVIEDLALNKKIKGYLAAGRELYNGGDYAKALSRFQMVLSVAPENREAIEYARKCQETIAAEAEREKAAAEKKQKMAARAGVLVNQARQSVADKAYQEAKDLLSEAIYLDPDNESAAQLMGEIEEQMTRDAARQEATQKSRQEKLAQINGALRNAETYYSRKQYLSALGEWERAVKLGVEGSDLYETQKKISEVQQLLAKSVEADYQKGMNYYGKKEYGQAAKYLQQVVNVFPDYKDARKNLSNAVGAVEETAQKLYQEGLVYEGIGQMDKARSKWEAVLKVMPLESNEYYRKAKQKLSRQ